MILVIVKSNNFNCGLFFTPPQALRFCRALKRYRKSYEIDGWMDIEFKKL